jgi:hypothetical protein
MSMIDTPRTEALSRFLDVTVARAKLITSNLANIDTPGYRTEACLVCPSTLRKSLQALARRGEAGDVVFDRTQNAEECAHIIGNYSAKVKAEEVRVAWCGEHLWIRLERIRHEAVTLVLRAPTSSQFSVLSSQFSGLYVSARK